MLKVMHDIPICKTSIYTQYCIFIKTGNSDLWVDEIEWNGQLWYAQKQIDSKDFKILDDHQNAFCLFCWFFEDQLQF